MRVVIVGAGVIGVCTAYYLNEMGCEVVVIERNSGVAQEASFGNAGVIAPGCVAPWAAPGMPRKILSYLLAQDSPVFLRPNLDPAFWRWILLWLGQCKLDRYRINRERMQRVAFYSRTKLHALRERHALNYEQVQGYLQLFRTEKERKMAAPGIDLLREHGVAHRLFSPAECRLQEPGLSEMPFDGGLHLPGDESGNCPLFTRYLKDITLSRGVRYDFNVGVTRLECGPTGVTVQAGSHTYLADAVVMAAGVASAPLLRPLGIALPLYPVKGYSASIGIKEPTYAPLASVMDEAYKVAMTRMGNRIRIAGTADLGSRTLAPRESALRTLIKVVRDWFPGAANYAKATFWTGVRPMLPEGAPLLGATHVPGLYLNLGHGSAGWAMACGSGKIVADVIAGHAPEIDLTGLTHERYANPPR